MPLVEIFVIAIALAMDALAVSVTAGVTITQMHLRHALRIACFFGGFQALMPVLGWLAGRWASDLIRPWDHWVAFVLLAAIGSKMLCESRKTEEVEAPTNPLGWWVLLVLAVATSIDALAAGVTFSFLDTSIVDAALIIGGVTFVLCLVGVWVGERLGHFFENKLELVGGLVLIGLGVKVLIEHLFFA